MTTKRQRRLKWNDLIAAIRAHTGKSTAPLHCLRIAMKHANIEEDCGAKTLRAMEIMGRYVAEVCSAPPAEPEGIWDRAKAHPEYKRIHAIVKAQMRLYWGKPQLARIVNALIAVEMEQSKAPADLRVTMARRLMYSITSINGFKPPVEEDDPQAMAPSAIAAMSKKDFFASPRWRALRYQVLLRDRNRCLACNASPETTGAIMQVDHIKPRSKYPELQWELSNLQCLCEDCNIGKGAWDETDWRFSALPAQPQPTRRRIT